MCAILDKHKIIWFSMASSNIFSVIFFLSPCLSVLLCCSPSLLLGKSPPHLSYFPFHSSCALLFPSSRALSLFLTHGYLSFFWSALTPGDSLTCKDPELESKNEKEHTPLIDYFHCPWFPPRNRAPIAEDTMHLRRRTWRNWTGSDLGAWELA